MKKEPNKREPSPRQAWETPKLARIEAGSAQAAPGSADDLDVLS